MTRQPAPHDFLLHLRGTSPDLARRFDGISGLSYARGELLIRAPDASWSHAELTNRLPDLRHAAADFFGPGTDVALEAGPSDPERLPFPVLSTKVWNHVAFWLPGPPASAVLAVRKTVCLDRDLPSGDGGDVFRREYPAPGGDASPAGALPDLLDDLCELGRAERSYVQLVTPFPDDRTADLLEGRLYAVKEWGTPRTPAAILQKYVGRLHYVSPSAPPLGIRALLGAPRPPLF